MNLTTMKKHIQEFIDEPLILNESEVKKFNSAYKIITDDIQGMIDGKEIEQNVKRVAEVMDIVLMISSKVLDAPLTDKFCLFVSSFSEMIFNWNNNIYQDELLRQIPLYMSRIVETRHAMIKTTKVMKDIDERIRILSSWHPPAYEIAIDYFEKLLKENGKE